MKWTVETIKIFLDEKAQLLPNKIKVNVPISFNGRLTRTLGRVKYCVNPETGIYTPTKMEFSKKLLETYSDEDIKQVLLHEFCHYYLFIIEPTVDHNHDEVFKHTCSQLGCKESAPIFHSSDSTSHSRQESFKYFIRCSECGKIIAIRKRKCKVVMHPELFFSDCCHADVKVCEK